MALQDLGSLADYLKNGDNWEKVQPDGSTLVIPSVYQQGLIIPAFPKDTYYVAGQCPGADQCAVVVHDSETNLYAVVKTCDVDPTLVDCAAECVQGVQDTINLLISEGGPFQCWIYDELGIPCSTPWVPDFYFVACYTGPILIPNVLTPKHFTCAPPGIIEFVNGVPICVFDPPVP